MCPEGLQRGFRGASEELRREYVFLTLIKAASNEEMCCSGAECGLCLRYG